MSKMSEEYNSLTVAAEPQPPAAIEGETAAFMRAIASGANTTLLGTLLLFKKGIWQRGETKEALGEGTCAIALMNEARHGWVYWPDNKKPIYQPGRIGKLCEGFTLPDRQMLGNLDQESWPIGLSGQHEDPWRKTIFLPMRLLDEDETILTFTSSSEGGRSAFYYLLKRYAWLVEKHVGQYPVIKLGVEEYEHPKFGMLAKPKLEITDWVGRSGVALTDDLGGGGNTASPPRRDDMDDEIPF
jgi:hypothetical protein